ncbi:hypothetical protein H6P81_016753 [Aristolochia fimbriata]|uniref:Ubiquitin-like domain-containing protein n=1 Tax=Aristolochia fimbriata TaxID=158543 RepID=A0AAV7EDU3_ARIFI|nr:hypothetical protein H6P81_016753 [Aristolochia fimbriata]
MAMYIRVKRNKTTYFLQCDPTETILDIKQKLHTLIDQPVSSQLLLLAEKNEVLEDSKTLAEQKVENDAVVALTLRKDDNEFEEVNIARPDDFYQSREVDGVMNCSNGSILEASDAQLYEDSSKKYMKIGSAGAYSLNKVEQQQPTAKLESSVEVVLNFKQAKLETLF